MTLISLNFGSFLILLITICLVAGGDVVLNINDEGQVTIANDLVNVTFDNNASVISLMKEGKDLVGTVSDRTFYFDWNAGGGKFLPRNFSVISNTSDLVHVMYFQPFSHKRLELEYHIAVFRDISGFYQWLKANDNGNETIKMSEFRMVYRLSKSLMPHISNMVRKGETPADLPKSPTIQDTTWQLPDGSYWSKYDYMGYIRETPWFGIYGVAADDVVLEVNDDGLVTIANGLISVTLDTNASVLSLIKDGKDLVGTVTARTFYFDWNAGGGKFLATNFSVIINTSDLVHVKYYQPVSQKRLELEYHIAVLRDVSGFYQWLKANNNGNDTLEMSEFRMVYNLSESLMPHISNMVRKGETPAGLPTSPTIQDTTWQLPDGSYWSKYDYMGYIRETPWFGVYGGGVGSWVVSASREYHSGGPLKQDLLTQHYSLMCHYLTSRHLGTVEFEPEPGWSKFYGPWLLYVNSGSDDEMLADVDKQAIIESSQWPYKWLEDSDYPLERGTVSGQVTGQTRAAVVLHDSFTEPFDLQTKGYLYNTETDEDGNYAIKNIRPGVYALVIYPLAGQGSENQITQNVTVLAGNQTIDSIELPEPTGIMWAIGETNRRADNFRYSDELRNFYWHVFPPENLTYFIGKSNSAKDWYYAQTHNGTWNIVFEDSPDGKPRTLRIAIAAASGSLIYGLTSARLHVHVNDVIVTDKEYENESAIYRGALQSGRFYSEKITIPADIVVEGTNVVSLTVVYGGFMYDAISYQRNQ